MNHFSRGWRRPAWVLQTCVTVALVAVSAGAGATAQAQQVGGKPPPCAAPSGPPAPVTPTTITSIEQAYYCIFANDYSGPVQDDRALLVGAFAGFTQELDRLGMEQADATMPALTGDRDADWGAFASVYERVVSQVPASPAQRQALAAATMSSMTASLGDNHAHWIHPQYPPGGKPGDVYGLGLQTSPDTSLAVVAPREALPPLFVTEVAPGSPAASQGIRPGDVIVSVDGAPPFVDGVPSQGVMDLLSATYPQARAVSVRLLRPATGHTWTVTLTPALFRAPTPAVSAKLLRGSVAYVSLPGFFPGAADQVLKAIATLGTSAKLRGLILDLRGNGGGSPAEDARLLGAFVHGRVWSYDCDVRGSCTANSTVDSVPPLHLPLVVLTDRDCVSACDAFSGAIKDLGLGTLVGTRTAGIVSGPAAGYVLDDGSLLILPPRHELGANREVINGIGVAPDYYIPLTARDLSTGHDPDIAKGLSLLT